MTITITTSNVNGIRAAKRKGIEQWAAKNTPDVWCMQEVRAPQNEIDPIFDEFGFEYATAGRIADQSGLDRMNELCRIKGRAGVGLLSALPVIDKRYGLPGLAEDVDSGRWIEADVKTPQGYTVTVVCVYVHAGNTDDPEKMKQKYRFLDTMLVRMGQADASGIADYFGLHKKNGLCTDKYGDWHYYEDGEVSDYTGMALNE